MAQAFANLQSKLVSQLTVHHLLKHGPDAYNIAVRIVKADTEMMEELRGLFEVRHAFDSHLLAPPPAARIGNGLSRGWRMMSSFLRAPRRAKSEA